MFYRLNFVYQITYIKKGLNSLLICYRSFGVADKHLFYFLRIWDILFLKRGMEVLKRQKMNKTVNSKIFERQISKACSRKPKLFKNYN